MKINSLYWRYFHLLTSNSGMFNTLVFVSKRNVESSSVLSSNVEEGHRRRSFAGEPVIRKTAQFRPQHKMASVDLKKMLKSKKHFSSLTGTEEPFMSIELKQVFLSICSDFLGEPWSRLSPDDLIIKHIKGGMSNMLFLCQLPEDHFSISNGGKLAMFSTKKHDMTLLRVYFNPEMEGRLVAESVIFTLLSERSVGPKLYGVFDDGRLEEFIPSVTLQTSDIWKPEMSRRIAQQMARLHRMELPISKSPTYLIDALDRWFSRLKSLKPDLKVAVTSHTNHLSLNDMLEDFDLIKTAISLIESPVVFCHNDLQEGNVLVPHENDQGQDLVVIDFEYASYNYRAFDFANHFCEWTLDYSSESPPYFHSTPSNFPTIKQQAIFFNSYLQELGFVECDAIKVQKLIDETIPFVPVSHFFWAIWALLQNEISPVTFDFQAYAQCRLESYSHLRGDLVRLLSR